MDLHLTGRVALVSGSSRGIGKTIAETLLMEGCTVYINGRDENSLNSTAEEFSKKMSKDKIRKICADLTNTDEIRKTLNIISRETDKSPDIVIANIGTGRSVQGWDIDDEEWLRMFNANFFGAVRLCREAIRMMKDGGGGCIIGISSIAGCEATPAPISYSSAKTALLSFVKNTANIVAQFGIRINTVSPGNVLFEGGTWDRKLKENKEEVFDYINAVVPMQGFASPYDIAHMVSFLVSDCAKFITGANFVVDGGQVRKFI